MELRRIVRAAVWMAALVSGALCLTAGCSKKPEQEAASKISGALAERGGAAEDTTEEIVDEAPVDETEPELSESGTLTDKRDGKKYKTTVVGGDRWMAENLNYKPRGGKSWCYDDDTSYCGKYGRLYDWRTAMIACPSGWHLSTSREWDSLAQAAGGREGSLLGGYAWVGAGKALKAKSGWGDDAAGKSGNGTDSYGFSALPGGFFHRFYSIRFDGAGSRGLWWTATEYNGRDAVHIEMGLFGTLEVSDSRKIDAYSVRCVRNSASTAAAAPRAEEQPPTAAKPSALDESGTLTDGRDGSMYKTAVIGGERWMAENLKYQPPRGSWCYDDDSSNCDKYGRMYDWSAAMNLDSSYNNVYWSGRTLKHQGICPAGWYLPSIADWGNLAKTAGGTGAYGDGGTAAKKLKAENGWADKDDGASGNGTDDYGFSALPGGWRRPSPGKSFHLGHNTKWWTSSAHNRAHAFSRSMFWSYDYVSQSELAEKDECYYVRCVQMPPPPPALTDGRDGKKYKTAVIGGKRWMAENLNYQTPSGSWCYGNNNANCAKFGRLYNWETAKTVCPAGWHLPSNQEWDSLGRAVGGFLRTNTAKEDSTVLWEGAGETLKAKRGWKNNGNGPDDYGFSALPSGGRDFSGKSVYAGETAFWWTATEKDEVIAYIREISCDYDLDYLMEGYFNKGVACSVRCVADAK